MFIHKQTDIYNLKKTPLKLRKQFLKLHKYVFHFLSPERRVWRHPGLRVPLQTPPDEVEEERVVASLERRLQLPRTRRAPRLAPAGPAAVQDGGAVREGRSSAVPDGTFHHFIFKHFLEQTHKILNWVCRFRFHLCRVLWNCNLFVHVYKRIKKLFYRLQTYVLTLTSDTPSS